MAFKSSVPHFNEKVSESWAKMFMRKVVSKESGKYPISFDVVRFVSAPFSANCYLISWNQCIHLHYTTDTKDKQDVLMIGKQSCSSIHQLLDEWSSTWSVASKSLEAFIAWTNRKLKDKMYVVKSRLRSLMRHWKALFKDVVPQELIINRGHCLTWIDYLHPRPWWEVVILKFQLLSIAHDNLWFHVQLHFVVVWCGMVIGFLFFIF